MEHEKAPAPPAATSDRVRDGNPNASKQPSLPVLVLLDR